MVVAKMGLVKARTLQKLAMLFLLAFGGLGYPRVICEGKNITCYWCKDFPSSSFKCSANGTGSEGDDKNICVDDFCSLFRGATDDGDWFLEKDCMDQDTVREYKCIQRFLGQTGSCLKTTFEEYSEVRDNCTSGNRVSTIAQKDKDNSTYSENCWCDSNLCNSYSILDNWSGPTTEPSLTTAIPTGPGGIGGDGNKTPVQSDAAEIALLKTKAAWLMMIIILVTNWILY